MDAFERYRTQFRFVSTPADFSYLIAQLHRALAKVERKLLAAESTPLPIMVADKGISEGPNLVLDWWTRMLSHMFRLSEESKRAIVAVYPNPFILMEKLLGMDPGEAIGHLANIKATNGIRVGPIQAQRLYMMLTSLNGDDILVEA